MLVIRGDITGNGMGRPAAVPVDGNGAGVEIPNPGGTGTTDTADWAWAPDDSSILGTPTADDGAVRYQVLLDPVRGTIRTPTWASISQATWQRLGP